MLNLYDIVHFINNCLYFPFRLDSTGKPCQEENHSLNESFKNHNFVRQSLASPVSAKPGWFNLGIVGYFVMNQYTALCDLCLWLAGALRRFLRGSKDGTNIYRKGIIG